MSFVTFGANCVQFCPKYNPQVEVILGKSPVARGEVSPYRQISHLTTGMRKLGEDKVV